MDKISVITTYYNAKDFIVNAIHSINSQEQDGTYELEYVLVNDCSTDGSEKIVDAYIKAKVPKNRTHQWKLLTPPKNLGCGGARKFGIEHSTGNYLMFLDADDYYIHSDFINRAHKDIIENDADIVEYGMRLNRANGEVSNVTTQKKTILTRLRDKELGLFRDNLIKFNVWTKIYRRKVVESFPYSTERTFEDVRTTPVWVANANKVVVMPCTEINYRAATGSIIRDDMMKTRLGTIQGISSHFERFKSEPEILKAMYIRAMIDLEAVLHNHSSENPGFNEMSRLNTYMLKFIYPTTYKDITYHIEDDTDYQKELAERRKRKKSE